MCHRLKRSIYFFKRDRVSLSLRVSLWKARVKSRGLPRPPLMRPAAKPPLYGLIKGSCSLSSSQHPSFPTMPTSGASPEPHCRALYPFGCPSLLLSSVAAASYVRRAPFSQPGTPTMTWWPDRAHMAWRRLHNSDDTQRFPLAQSGSSALPILSREHPWCEPPAATQRLRTSSGLRRRPAPAASTCSSGTLGRTRRCSSRMDPPAQKALAHATRSQREAHLDAEQRPARLAALDQDPVVERCGGMRGHPVSALRHTTHGTTTPSGVADRGHGPTGAHCVGSTSRRGALRAGEHRRVLPTRG